jgi:hypothetical protein
VEQWYTYEWMKIRAEGRSVISELFVEVAGFLLVSIPGYVLALDWGRLTISLGVCILFTRFAIGLRKQSYDKSE